MQSAVRKMVQAEVAKQIGDSEKRTARKLYDCHSETTDRMKNLDLKIESGFAQQGVFDFEFGAKYYRDIHLKKQNALREAQSAPPHFGRDFAENKTRFSPYARSRSDNRSSQQGSSNVVRPRSNQVVKQVETRANSIPRAKQWKFSCCPFCNQKSCTRVVDCALTRTYDERKKVWEKRGLCPDQTCFKQHSGQCHKKNQVTCRNCGDDHHIIYCETVPLRDKSGGGQDSNLTESEQMLENLMEDLQTGRD